MTYKFYKILTSLIIISFLFIFHYYLASTMHEGVDRPLWIYFLNPIIAIILYIIFTTLGEKIYKKEDDNRDK
ncbi:hypothetical protein CW695_11210 [Macrococcoides caseolyticum]|nr:hypothetical protein CW695_11210 [Macrococcus caseolyticus]PKE48246.1 hypothetical protein CW672_10880 [Macrococcus caseolyticus]PKE60031.1 hypothetical protein CW669_10780 [Macrococcus caseolyticus]PKE62165.1 hypothetical protein CW683_11795 [Macrococcus caseolyticus]PKE66807.1 hypothetical protein CW663_11310 [Macrococcus caseolyticus]